MKKAPFDPEITVIKLNPEQAVLACSCYNGTRYATASATRNNTARLCSRDVRVIPARMCGSRARTAIS